jgi:16S rRNA (cytosine967-C5)-methyltransferase
VAADLSRQRLGRLREPVARLGLDVCLLQADARSPALGRARTVLLDAPCTGTGVLRRRPDARWRLDQGKLDSLVVLQRELLDATVGLVEPGGLLVYATCSLEPEENEEQVDGFLTRNRDFRRERPEPAWVPVEAVDERGDLRVSPWVWDTDGAFASRLRRL